MKSRLTRRLGFWSSVFVAVLGGIYLLLLLFTFSTGGFAFPPPPIVQFVAGIITFLTVPGLVVLFTAIRHGAGEGRSILGSLSVSFITLFAATVSINRFIQLTVIQQSTPGDADLARFLPYATDSVMFALEMLGWGFFSSLAALAAAGLFSGSRLNLSIRWLFITYAAFSFMGAIGYATTAPITAGAFVAWGPILLALSILLAVYFRKADVPASKP
jgi:hypothetical protein